MSGVNGNTKWLKWMRDSIEGNKASKLFKKSFGGVVVFLPDLFLLGLVPWACYRRRKCCDDDYEAQIVIAFNYVFIILSDEINQISSWIASCFIFCKPSADEVEQHADDDSV